MLRGRHVALVVISAFAAGAFYLGVALYAGLDEVASAWRQVGPGCMGVALLATLMSVTLRCLRWRMFLRALDHDLPLSVHLPIYCAGLSLTTVPGKLGELIRSVFLRQHGVPYPRSIAAFLADRLADLTGVMLLAALLSWIVYPAARMLLVPAVGLVAGLAAFRMGYLPLAGRLLDVVPQSSRLRARLGALDSVFDYLRMCLALPLFGMGLIVAVLAYSTQALALVLVLSTLAEGIAPAQVFLAFLLATLGGAAIMLPAGLGGMEAALIALLHHFGTPLPAAVAATVLIRLATLWFVVALGLCCLVWVQWRASDGTGALPEAPA